MTIVVEDGTGKINAESYISVADATTYHAARGNAAWAALATDAVREQSLRKATEYMGQVYRLRWKGARYTTTQALDWPRSNVYVDSATVIENDDVPVEVVRACAEYALKASAATLYADEDRAAIREKVGPIETEYSAFSSQTKRYPSIDALLAPYLSGGNGQYLVART